MKRLAAIIGAIAVAWVWLAAASALPLAVLGLWDDFRFPWWQWAVGALTFPSLNWWVKLWIIVGALVPSAAIWMVWTVVNRARRAKLFQRMTAPIGGGVRPIVPGPTDNFGHARILTDREALARYPGPDGVVIGEVLSARPGRGRLVIDPCTTGAGHGMMIAGSRAGKTSSAVTALLYWPGSAVVLDPSREIGGMLRDEMERRGKRVIILDPREPSSGFNALRSINPAMPLAGMEVKALIDLIFPDEAHNAKSPSDPYFEPSGRSLCVAILSDLIWSDRPAEEKTLRTLRELVVTPENLMPRLLQTIHAQSASPLARDLAGSLMRITPRQFSGIYGQATQGTEWLSEPDYVRLISSDAFNVQDILKGDVVIFVQVPLPALMQNAGIGRVIIGSLMNAVYRAEGACEGRVLFPLDEAWALGRMAVQKAALVVGAKFGITLLFFYQSAGQVREIWGEDGVTTLMNNLSWRSFAAVRDPKTARELSDDLGTIGVMAWSEGINTGRQRQYGRGFGSRSTGDTTNVSEIKRPLELPQEIQGADPDILYVIAGQDRMKLRMPAWWRRPELQGVVGASRFHHAAQA
jgi:type IV secretion system protein VirD4